MTGLLRQTYLCLIGDDRPHTKTSIIWPEKRLDAPKIMTSSVRDRSENDRRSSFLIGGLESAIFDLLGDLSKSGDLDWFSISILKKKRPVLMRHAYVLLL